MRDFRACFLVERGKSNQVLSGHGKSTSGKSHDEITSRWRRYRLIDPDRLCWRVGASNFEDVRKNLEASLAERIARDQMNREPRWTESLAVVSTGFVERIKPLISSRREIEIVGTDENIWVLKATDIPYGQKTGPKSSSKTVS